MLWDLRNDNNRIEALDELFVEVGVYKKVRI